MHDLYHSGILCDTDCDVALCLWALTGSYQEIFLYTLRIVIIRSTINYLTWVELQLVYDSELRLRSTPLDNGNRYGVLCQGVKV